MRFIPGQPGPGGKVSHYGGVVDMAGTVAVADNAGIHGPLTQRGHVTLHPRACRGQPQDLGDNMKSTYQASLSYRIC